ncbi:RNA polymerase sigma-70 factor [Flavihumibacter rivuli]|uniref:RNA polymerase sigma factor n=1 Tax=Flavihumibacter rivuli TaxID=2838156 RepID=UPI001BDEFCFE|nr:RNA polymerase sigma-70 factor [Flavihumibacter rivuli]ULQ55450.1 RNA polymerase sigma-70 factor [Flavihumibacter rivuli]
MAEELPYSYDEMAADFRAGKESAYDHFFRQYHAPLCYMAYRILQDQQAAEDVVQDCFLKLWLQRHQMQDTRQVVAYLYTTVRNAAIDAQRKGNVRDRNEAAYANLTDSPVSLADDHLLIEAETLRRLYSSIDQLPPRIREVVELHFLQDKSYREISELLQTSPETIRKQKARALAILKQLLMFCLFFSR